MKEIWKPIKGFEELYHISNHGRVKSFYGKTRILKDHPTGTHYRFVRLWKDGKYHTFQAHRLVAESFIPNPLGKPQVNHLDGTRTNNHVDNLEWCTRSENYFHAEKLGCIPVDRNRGEKNGLSVLDRDKVISIRRRKKEGESYKSIASSYGISIGCVQGVVYRKTWRHI